MIKKTLLLSLFGLCLISFTSCDDEACDFDISGTYTFQSASCEGVDYPQTVTISNSATEFTFEGSRYTIGECEVTEENIESQRKVSFDDGGFDFEGEFDNGSVTVNCDGRYTKN